MAVLRSLEAVRGPGRFGHRNEHVDNMVHLLFLMTVSNVYSENIISYIYIYILLYTLFVHIYIYIAKAGGSSHKSLIQGYGGHPRAK